MKIHKKKCVCGHLLDVEEVYQQGREQGKVDGAKEFAEALRVNFDLYAWKNSDEVIDYTLSEMQKGTENE